MILCEAPYKIHRMAYQYPYSISAPFANVYAGLRRCHCIKCTDMSEEKKQKKRRKFYWEYDDTVLKKAAALPAPLRKMIYLMGPWHKEQWRHNIRRVHWELHSLIDTVVRWHSRTRVLHADNIRLFYNRFEGYFSHSLMWDQGLTLSVIR